MVRYYNGLLTLLSKCCKDRPIMHTRFTLVTKCIYDMSTETFVSMCSQVGCPSMVFGIQVLLDDTTPLAFLGHTPKNMKFAAMIMSDFHMWLKKAIHWECHIS